MKNRAVDLTEGARETGILEALWKLYEQMGVHVIASSDELAAEAFLEASMRPIRKEICRVIYQNEFIGMLSLTSGDYGFGGSKSGDAIHMGPTNILIAITADFEHRLWALAEPMSDAQAALLQKADAYVRQLPKPASDPRMLLGEKLP